MKCQWWVSVCTVHDFIIYFLEVSFIQTLSLLFVCLCLLPLFCRAAKISSLVLYCHLVVIFGFLLLLKKQNSSAVKTFSASPLSPSCEVLSGSVHIKLIDLS